MNDQVILAAFLFGVLSVAVAVFQIALVLGAPWGAMAMGGKYPGRFPPWMRIVAFVQVNLFFLITLVVAVRAKLVFSKYYEISTTVIWFVVLFCAVGMVLNTITPSKKEKALWLPVITLLFLCSIIVATS